MKNILLLLSVVAMIVLTACSSETRRPKTEDKTGSTSGTSTANAEPVAPIDPGDIETQVFLEAIIDEAAVPPTVKVEKLESAKKHVSLETVTVIAPFPTELPMIFRVVSDKAFPEIPFVVHAKIFRDKEQIKTFNTVVLPDPPTTQAAPKPFEFRTNILEGISAPPNTMLVTVQAEVILLKKGTPLNTINPETIQSTDGQTGSLLGNPVRINFGPIGVGS